MALAALALKITCALLGLAAGLALWRRGAAWTPKRQRAVWATSLACGVIALVAAAFLRWYL